MRTVPILRVAVLAFVAGTFGLAAEAQGGFAEASDQLVNHLVVRAQVISETAKPISPTSTNTVILASRYAYHLRVKQVIQGEERRSEIEAIWERDGALLKDRDFVFHLIRMPDGSYNVESLDRIK